jgi:hypothetical protein
VYCVVCGNPLDDSIAFGTERIFCDNCVDDSRKIDIHSYTVEDVISEILDDDEDIYEKLGALGKDEWSTLVDVIAADIADRFEGFDLHHLIGLAYDELKDKRR